MGSFSNPILQSWVSVLARNTERAAIVDSRGATLRTFAEIEADATRAAETLALGAPQSVAAIQIGNSPLLPGLLIALWRRRLVPVLLDQSLTDAARDHALTTCGADFVVSIGEAAPFQIETRRGSPAPDGTDFLKLTSGTSGMPRAIRFTAEQLLADCTAVCETMGITDRDLNYGVIPWSHSYGFSNLVTPLLCRGIPVVATDDRLPRAIMAGLTATKATIFPGLPVFYEKLAQLPGMSPHQLRVCISAGAPLPQSTADTFRTKFGRKIHGFYGSSECGGITYDSSEDAVPSGCVGEPMKGVHLSHDPESGRIEIRGAAVGIGYYPAEDPAVLGNSRFLPGDLMARTPSGFVIAGRVSDFINVAGKKLNPTEVENVIRSHAGVREVVVFGVAHALRGEEPIACIVGIATAKELIEHCAAVLAPWQIPRTFWHVETLPVNERGKWSRRALAEKYLQRLHPE